MLCLFFILLILTPLGSHFTTDFDCQTILQMNNLTDKLNIICNTHIVFIVVASNDQLVFDPQVPYPKLID